MTMIGFFLFLWVLWTPLWLWLCSRIWKSNKTGAILSLLFTLPAFYFAAKVWDEPDAKIKLPAYANIAIFALLTIVWIQLPSDWMQQFAGGTEYAKRVKKAEKKRASSEMERWCQEKNDASYDPDLKTCVERKKTDIMAQGLDKATFSRLNSYLERNGIKGEIDHSQSSESIKLTKSTEIADVAAYYFLPFSMSQPRISFYLCVSANACANYVENIKDRSVVNLIRNNNLLLSVPWESLEEPKTKELINVFLDFKAAQ
jgi:hypothetical protein